MADDVRELELEVETTLAGLLDEVDCIAAEVGTIRELVELLVAWAGIDPANPSSPVRPDPTPRSGVDIQ